MQEGVGEENMWEWKQIFECNEITLIQNISSYSDFLKKDLQFLEYFIILAAKKKSNIPVPFTILWLIGVLWSINLIHCPGYLLATQRKIPRLH